MSYWTRPAPDLILTQELCDVCAVSYRQVEAAASMLQCDTRVVSLEPNTLDQILDTIRIVGELAGVESQAKSVVSSLRARIDRVGEIAARAQQKPRVLCMEWIDPVFIGGHWVPEMVALCGWRRRPRYCREAILPGRLATDRGVQP